MKRGASILRLLRRLAFVGVSPHDSEDTRAQKATLTLASALVTILAIIWVSTYWCWDSL